MERKYSELDHPIEMKPREFADDWMEDISKLAEENIPEFIAEAKEHFSDSEANLENL